MVTPSIPSLYSKYKVEFWLVVGGFVILAIASFAQTLCLLDVSTRFVPRENFVYFPWGVQLDDVFIHCRFAYNLLHGNGLAFNPGEHVSADTAPLWVLLIALGGIFSTHLENVAITLSIAFYLILAPGVYRTARDVFRLKNSYAILAGVITLISGRLIWSGVSGMETSLAALLALLAIEEHTRQEQRGYIRLREGLWLGLGFSTRPEFLLLIALCVMHWCYEIWKRKVKADGFALLLVTILLCAMPALLFNLFTSGALLSHSSVVQGARVSLMPDLYYLKFIGKALGTNNLVAALLSIVAIYVLLRKKAERMCWWLPITFVVGLPILQAFIAPQYRHHGRYVFIVFPALSLIACAMLERLAQVIERKKLEGKEIAADNWIVGLSVLFLIAGGMVEAGRWIVLSAEGARNINDQQMAIAHWIPTHLNVNDRLAVDDVGAIAYYTNRPLIDLTGLVSPKLFRLQHDQDSVWQEAVAEGANIFIIYDRLNPPFYRNHQNELELIDSFQVRKPLVASADFTMNVYRRKEIQHAN